MFKNLICAKEESVYTIKIAREKYLNALNEEVLKELDMAIDIINNDEEIHVGIITGEGKAFVAGADIEAMKDMNFEEARIFSKTGNRLFRKIENCEKPIIAAINGFCLGGGLELAMSCDIRIASTKAKFGQVEANLGILPGFGGTQRLPRIVGVGKAKELVYSAQIITSKEALNINLVNKVVEQEDLVKECVEMAKLISSKGQLAIRYAKNAINRGYEIDIDSAINLENNLFGLCFASYDQEEGMSAFLEKREPKFNIHCEKKLSSSL
ncbi:enoyl-CoA hydratase-related protein [Clostridium sp. CCUG 7971]|uniref:enoyl-CoA hydratase-related protein n=1 Tax=Clostridium sp. CCUG 7971 TaxID=2811414 RepID=UPI001ABAD1AB|nr:enoyl-CoA hydratase-related protein [Clostridium sp. CCUG 7971]MBO3446057.1 enoyl-CoA hydratase/isomerase family protein [Clostridium sp. CCUG 7971]